MTSMRWRPITTSPDSTTRKKPWRPSGDITDPVRSSYLAAGYDYDTMVRIFERDAIGLIEKNPDVKFDIYFPPYSILQFVAMRDASPATLKIVYDFTAYAASRLIGFSNVQPARFPRRDGNHPQSRQLRRRDPPLARDRPEGPVADRGAETCRRSFSAAGVAGARSRRRSRRTGWVNEDFIARSRRRAVGASRLSGLDGCAVPER